jgi:hypothetical protein
MSKKGGETERGGGGRKKQERKFWRDIRLVVSQMERQGFKGAKTVSFVSSL